MPPPPPGKGTLIEQAETRTKQAELRAEKAETQGESLRVSELSYRSLFKSARDGILILDADTGRVTDVNPFLVELLGFSHGEMVGQTVGELSPFKDIVSNQAMLTGIALLLSRLPFLSSNLNTSRGGSGPTQPDGGRP